MSKNKETTETNAQDIDIPKFDKNRPSYDYDFGPDFIKLFVSEPFLGGICANVIRYENWKVPTAYIGYNLEDKNIVLGYNPEFMARLTKLQRQWVIKHEIYHLCLQHILGRANTNRKTKQIFNIAADLAVNSLLGKENMFEYALMPGMFPKNCKDQAAGELIESFKPEQSTEYYMEALRRFVEKNQKEKCPVCAAQRKEQNSKDKKTNDSQKQNENHEHNSSNSEESCNQEQNEKDQNQNNTNESDHDKHNHDNEEGNGPLCEEHAEDEEVEYVIGIGGAEGESMDGHPGWGDIPNDIREIINEKIKDIISDGVKRAQMKGNWGSVPSSMQAIIQQLLTSEIDWKSILRFFIGRSRSVDRDSTIKRVNKKAPYIFPGVRRKTVAKLAFFIDQSGSMSDEDVQLAMAAAFECSKETEIDVYNFDTTVDESSHQVWKKGKNVEWHRTRCGGTDFDGVRNFVSKSENRGRWTGIAIVTDGYAPKMSQLIGVKIIWLVTPNGTLDYVREGDLVVKMKEEKTAKIKR